MLSIWNGYISWFRIIKPKKKKKMFYLINVFFDITSLKNFKWCKTWNGFFVALNGENTAEVHRLKQLNLTQQLEQQQHEQAWMPSWELALGQMVNPSLNQSETQQKANVGVMDPMLNYRTFNSDPRNFFVWTSKSSACSSSLDLLVVFFSFISVERLILHVLLRLLKACCNFIFLLLLLFFFFEFEGLL